MSLTNSPLGIFLITSIALGGVLERLSYLLCQWGQLLLLWWCVSTWERETTWGGFWHIFLLSWNSAMPQQTNKEATRSHREIALVIIRSKL